MHEWNQLKPFPGLLQSHQRLGKTFCALSGRKTGSSSWLWSDFTPGDPPSWKMLSLLVFCDFDRMVQVPTVDRALNLMAGQIKHLCPLGWQQRCSNTPKLWFHLIKNGWKIKYMQSQQSHDTLFLQIPPVAVGVPNLPQALALPPTGRCEL